MEIENITIKSIINKKITNMNMNMNMNMNIIIIIMNIINKNIIQLRRIFNVYKQRCEERIILKRD